MLSLRIWRNCLVVGRVFVGLLLITSARTYALGQQYPSYPTRGSAVVAALPAALLQCEGDQCTRGGGGALWVFDGTRGQAMWHYGAVADLTVERYDGRTIVLTRADPPGTYSSRWAGRDGYFRARYTGIVRGNRIDGAVYFNGDTSHPGTWYATISGMPCTAGGPCPLSMDQVRELGRRSQNARLFRAAALCSRIAGAPAIANRAVEGSGVIPANSAGICRSKEIREAMQVVESHASHDPNGTLLSLLGCGITGVCASGGDPTILQSRPSSDGGGFTAHDPGSFLCQGLFSRGDVHMKVGKNGDLESELTKDAMDELLREVPNFVESFKVRPLKNGNFLLILVTTSLQLSKEYSQEFSYP